MCEGKSNQRMPVINTESLLRYDTLNRSFGRRLKLGIQPTLQLTALFSTNDLRVEMLMKRDPS